MKILVTGSHGFIGSHLCDYLREKGHQVVGVDNLMSGRIENNPDMGFYQVDIRDEDKILEIFQKERPDLVFHLAAVSRTPWAIEKRREAYEINEMGSFNILDAAERTKVKKVVLASSNIVYAAKNAYKYSKLGMEDIARDFNDMYGLPTVCLRFSNVAGSKRQHHDNVLAALAKSKKEKGRITITGDGKQTRNFTFVGDICEALWLAAVRDDVGTIDTSKEAMQADNETIKNGGLSVFSKSIRGTEIDIMHPKTWELNEIAKIFDCPIDYVEDRKGDIKHLVMGIGPEKAKELLGFEAKTDLTEYIKIYTE